MVFGLDDKGVEEADCEKGGHSDDESDIVHFELWAMSCELWLLVVVFVLFQVYHYHLVFAVEQAGADDLGPHDINIFNILKEPIFL